MMSVEKKVSAQLPGDEISNIAQNPRRDIVEARIARLVYELNAGSDLFTDSGDFPTIEAKNDWQEHVNNQPSMGD